MPTDLEPAPVELSDGRTVALHEARRQEPGEFGIGAYHDGELVGLLVCEPDDRGNGHLNVYVAPEWRGVGVGAAMVRHMAERAAGLGLTYLTLAFAVDNEAASRMLEATGLVLARRIRGGIEKVAVFVPRAEPSATKAAAAAA